MSTLQERIERSANNTPVLAGGRVCASSLSRVLDHVNNSDMFAMFTTTKPELTDEQNRANNSKLVKQFSQHKVGPLKLVGSWKDSETGDWYEEDSYLFPYYEDRSSLTEDDFEILVRKLAKKYDQDAYIIGGPDGVFLEQLSPSKTTVPFSQFGTLTGLKELKKKNLEFMWSKVKSLRKRDVAFKFSGVLVPTGHLSALTFERCGLTWW